MNELNNSLRRVADCGHEAKSVGAQKSNTLQIGELKVPQLDRWEYTFWVREPLASYVVRPPHRWRINIERVNVRC